MTSKPDQSQLDKLPKWAQSYIQHIEMEREAAVRALNQYCDDQTESPFSITELESTGEERGPSFKVRYVQTHRITVKWECVELNVLLRDDCIDIQWESYGDSMREVALIPRSFQAAKLKSAANMRK